MKINIKKLTKTAKMPTRGSKSAAGYDLYADIADSVAIAPHATIKIPTNLSMQIPEGYYGAIFARSGMASARGLRPANAVGIIDEDFRGNITVALHNDTDCIQIVDADERIAQIIIQPYLSVEFEENDELDDTERGIGGFGSTGTK